MKSILALTFTLFFVINSKAYQGDSYKLVRFTGAKDKKTATNTLSTYGYRVVETLEQIDLYVVEPNGNKSANEKGLKTDEKILYVENNGRVHADVIPNDEFFSRQQGMTLIGAPAAWNITTGSRDIVVAVSDTGIDLDHSDLVANLWTNTRETPGNGIDDDQNGFIDDVHGFNFDGNNGNPNDGNMHGTHCAGIIGATGNNTTGVVGVNWRVKLMAVKFLSDEGSGSDLNGIKTILYAVDNGARVINASWGGGGASQAMADALNYAADHDVLFVAAAGNDKTDTDQKPHNPASYYHLPSVISVASATTTGDYSSFSNYGKTSVHVAAPGSAIYSTVHNNRYDSLSGTSMATPHVAGLAALILSAHPDLTVIELRNAILNAVTRSATWTERVATGGWINAELALQQFNNGPQIWPGQFRVQQGRTHHFTAYNAGPVSWSTSDTQIATIDVNGLLNAIQPGVVQVSATNSQGITLQSASLQVFATPKGGCGSGSSPARRQLAGVGVSESGLLALPLFLIGFIRLRSSRRKNS